MLYFKRKDGSVFGKLDSINKDMISGFLKKGYERCDKKGTVAKPKKALVLKKKK